jgi:hypothetical protein
MHDVNWVSFLLQLYFILQMQLNDVHYLEVAYQCENLDKESSSSKLGVKKNHWYVILAHFESSLLW